MRVKIVECVPNFSEGQSQEVIDAISNAIKATPGVSLLGVDPGPSTNRTVYTFVGSPDAVIQGALSAARVAYKLIDMSKHKGEHPRLGAMDVCPFIPIQGVEMEECVYCARKFGEKLALELNVPVYVYGFAAQQDNRRTVPQIRAGEYEGLSEKILKPEWKPDYGPAEFVPNWGATMSGARKFLIAYNINVLSTKEQAHRIALDIREEGRAKDQPGSLKSVQAMGWWLDEENIAQVSVNVLDQDVTPVHVVYEEICKLSRELKLAVTGSQIVGLVPLKALLLAAEFYMQKENLFVLEEDQKVHLAINRLGLNSIEPFDPKERIIEYMLPGDRLGPLVQKTLCEFIHTVGARTPTPGGGSVAAAVASLGAALGAMVGKMTYGKRQWEKYDEQMRRLIPVMHHTMNDLIPMVDADTGAFNDYMAAHKLPKATPEEEEVREAAMQAGLKKAINVPLEVARSVSKLWDTARELASIINIGARADLQVGARCLETGVFGAHWNVILNCHGLKDEAYRNKVLEEIEQYRQDAIKGCADVIAILESRVS
uniref:Formimidoyltransferase-cyclodeaminase n=1 Tax=Ornithodoros turicata TaxID=34597 RepID=A0A2R5LEJ1_9ACAR